MALTQLGSPYPVFTDLDGTPLDGGFVYFGVADDNPETAPILVYYDQELTQVAPQPLRTVNGYVMRNGAPAILYADDTFSVTVRNRRGALVIYAARSFGFLPGGGLRSQNNLSDVDSAAASLVNLGVTATAAELNFSDGVTSNIQTQLDGKADDTTQDQSTWNTGTSTVESLISPSKLFGAVSAQSIISRENTFVLPITAGGVAGVSYSSESFTPLIVQCFLECLTADLGYTVGSIVPISSHLQGNGSFGQYVSSSGNSATVRFGSAAGVYQLLNATTGTVGTITPANWALIVRVLG